jgi:rare lipoprotein A
VFGNFRAITRYNKPDVRDGGVPVVAVDRRRSRQAVKLRHVAVFASCALLGACASHAPKRGAAPASARAPSRAEPGDDVSRSQSERYRQNSDNGPAAPPIDVSKIPEPVPKSEPRSRYGNKDNYEVLGKTYRVLPDGRGYVERGIASWYGNKFHGYMTSSFEKYDMYAFSAAHKTLPLPSYARVTNLDNGKSVVVRVNDRGPFHENRVIDLSYAAAVKIGVWPKGTGLVEVRAIDPRVRTRHCRRVRSPSRPRARPRRRRRRGRRHHRNPRHPRPPHSPNARSTPNRCRSARRASTCNSAPTAIAPTPNARCSVRNARDWPISRSSASPSPAARSIASASAPSRMPTQPTP